MIRIGIMGLGYIAERVAQGIAYADHSVLYAVASRSEDKARDFSQRHKVEKYYTDYERMCMDQNVDLVYICTPNFLHKEHIMLCLKHHKHVICEKPMTANRFDLRECFDYAKKQKCFLMEAHKTLFTPLNRKIKRMIDSGEIGDIQLIDAKYCMIPGDNLAEWLHREKDGGVIYDIGVYPICYANAFANSIVTDVQMMKKCAAEGYTVQVQAMIEYENGVMAHIVCSWLSDMDKKGKGYIYGNKGYIFCDNYWKNTKAYLVKNNQTILIKTEMDSDFSGEISHAVNCIQNGQLESPICGYRQSDEILKVVEKVHDQ